MNYPRPCCRCGLQKMRDEFVRDCNQKGGRRRYCYPCGRKSPAGTRRELGSQGWRADIEAYPELAPVPLVINGVRIA